MTMHTQIEVPKSLAIDWWNPVINCWSHGRCTCTYYEMEHVLSDGTELRGGELHLEDDSVTSQLTSVEYLAPKPAAH